MVYNFEPSLYVIVIILLLLHLCKYPKKCKHILLTYILTSKVDSC
jgi:hypothetical protein